ncbi:MAG: hypothetical protein ABSE57_26445 [Bryobacteraceae bacterium]|jgi:hypothetical protein
MGNIPTTAVENTEYRDIPTDGRERQKTVEDSYYGLPSGKWQGDTLVIDSHNSAGAFGRTTNHP